jgi:hypothetical protein
MAQISPQHTGMKPESIHAKGAGKKQEASGEWHIPPAQPSPCLTSNRGEDLNFSALSLQITAKMAMHIAPKGRGASHAWKTWHCVGRAVDKEDSGDMAAQIWLYTPWRFGLQYSLCNWQDGWREGKRMRWRQKRPWPSWPVSFSLQCRCALPSAHSRQLHPSLNSSDSCLTLYSVVHPRARL